MNIYQASYFMQYGHGAYDEYEYVVVANTESEALGLALEAEHSTKGEGWSITELGSSIPTAHYMSSRSS